MSPLRGSKVASSSKMRVDFMHRVAGKEGVPETRVGEKPRAGEAG